jgi:hypothetical protein
MNNLNRSAVAAALLLATLGLARPAYAQVDFSGEWAPRFHEDQPERVPDADHYPLSPAQRGIWVASQMDGGSIAYSMAEALLIEGQLAPDAGL